MFDQVLGTDGVVNPGQLAKGSRLEFDAFLNTLPDTIQVELRNGNLKLSDVGIVATKPVDGRTIRLIETQDTKEVGYSSLDRGRLSKGQAVLVSGVVLLAAITYKDGTTPADDPTLAMTAKWFPIDTCFPLVKIVGRNATGVVTLVEEGQTTALTSTIGTIVEAEGDEPFAGLETGVISLRAAGKDIFKEMPLHNFKKNPVSQYPGYYKLDNPRMLLEDTELKLEVELGQDVSANGTDECVWLKAILVGTGTVSA
jgi:hypothetical protein